MNTLGQIPFIIASIENLMFLNIAANVGGKKSLFAMSAMQAFTSTFTTYFTLFDRAFSREASEYNLNLSTNC
jgi:hypothetical protein